ncbi:hypothetical protein ACOMHN_031640 [Nucella lapillus]
MSLSEFHDGFDLQKTSVASACKSFDRHEWVSHVKHTVLLRREDWKVVSMVCFSYSMGPASNQNTRQMIQGQQVFQIVCGV